MQSVLASAVGVRFVWCRGLRVLDTGTQVVQATPKFRCLLLECPGIGDQLGHLLIDGWRIGKQLWYRIQR